MHVIMSSPRTHPLVARATATILIPHLIRRTQYYYAMAPDPWNMHTGAFFSKIFQRLALKGRSVGYPSYAETWQPMEQAPSNTPYTQMPYEYSGSASSPGPSHTIITEEHSRPMPSIDPAAEPLYLANCEWGYCQILLDDTSPAGIMRHLREWHLGGDNKPFNKTRRGHCQWAGGCGKEMAYASFGKHVSYVHLRHDIRCPHCNRDIGRAGLLPLHLERYCRRAPKQEPTA